MAEPFFRMMEILVPSIVAANGNKITFEGLENIPERGGALIALNHTSYVDWVPASIAAHHRRRRLRFMIKAEMQDVRAVNYVIKHAQLIRWIAVWGPMRTRWQCSGCGPGNSLGYTRRRLSAAASNCASSRPERPGWRWRRRCRLFP